MDMKIYETKQGAATTSDLSQQEHHEEVAELKSSAASSDERLAAGVSTIGLQTKRLSGAQRKRLTRERLRVLQVNLHYSRAATAALCAAMRDCDVALIQEPWTYKREIKGCRCRTNL
jgi:hypothetical protein